jgi:hypothetical protein
LIGSLRSRTPVAAKTALSTAGANADVPGSPMPLGFHDYQMLRRRVLLQLYWTIHA